MPKFMLPVVLVCGLVGCGQASLDGADAETTVKGADSSSAPGDRTGADPRGGMGGNSHALGVGIGGSLAKGGGAPSGGPLGGGGASNTAGGIAGAVDTKGASTGGRNGGTVGGATGPTAGMPGGAGGNKSTGGRPGAGDARSSGSAASAGGRSGLGGGASIHGGSASTGGRIGTDGAGRGGAANDGLGGTGGVRAGVGGSNADTSSPSTDEPCPGATQTLTVGSGEPYATVQAAVNAISSSNSKLIQIRVKAGTYKEQVTISKPFVCLTGESATTTVITNALGTNIVTGGTVIVTGNDFSAANITFQNTGGDGSGQAVALMAKGQRQQFRNCRFLSYQDTLYVNTGTQYFKDCYIQGDTDYIFGDATAVFENCTMNNVAEGTAVTAPRTPENAAYGFVFLGGSLTADSTTSMVRSNHVYLGRPWGPYAAASFLNVAMGSHIAADGWTTMSSNTLAQTRFSEYKSTGAGANPTNANRASRQLTEAQAANYTVAKVLSPWAPGYSK